MTNAAGSGVERRGRPAGRSARSALHNRSRRFIAAAAFLILLSGCSRTQQDWRTAQQAGTRQAYQVFLERHPDTELAGIARQRIAQLTEEAAWQQATRVNTPAAYRGYLTKYPNGSWSQDARIRMESRSLAAEAAQGAQATPTTQATGAPITPAQHAVQLGAFSSAANARAAWKQLSSRFPSDIRGLTPQLMSVSVSGRRLYRLQTQVGSQAEARHLCRQLQQHSQPCLPLP